MTLANHQKNQKSDEGRLTVQMFSKPNHEGANTMKYQYAIVQNPGTDEEEVIAEYEKYMEAIAACMPDQDVMKYQVDGHLTTEF